MRTTTWELAPKHSFIQFKVKYLQISSITGYFHKFGGTVATDGSFNEPEVSVQIEAKSVETFSEKWNTLLRSEDFLFPGQYPRLSFSSIDGCRKSSGKVWEITGLLTIRTISRPVTLIINLFDLKPDRKKPTAVFHLFGSISRKEFGLSCPEENEIADEVIVNAEIMLIKKA